jgi:hypothetical protein
LAFHILLGSYITVVVAAFISGILIALMVNACCRAGPEAAMVRVETATAEMGGRIKAWYDFRTVPRLLSTAAYLTQLPNRVDDIPYVSCDLFVSN